MPHLRVNCRRVARRGRLLRRHGRPLPPTAALYVGSNARLGDGRDAAARGQHLRRLRVDERGARARGPDDGRRRGRGRRSRCRADEASGRVAGRVRAEHAGRWRQRAVSRDLARRCATARGLARDVHARRRPRWRSALAPFARPRSAFGRTRPEVRCPPRRRPRRGRRRFHHRGAFAAAGRAARDGFYRGAPLRRAGACTGTRRDAARAPPPAATARACPPAARGRAATRMSRRPPSHRCTRRGRRRCRRQRRREPPRARGATAAPPRPPAWGRAFGARRAAPSRSAVAGTRARWRVCRGARDARRTTHGTLRAACPSCILRGGRARATPPPPLSCCSAASLATLNRAVAPRRRHRRRHDDAPSSALVANERRRRRYVGGVPRWPLRSRARRAEEIRRAQHRHRFHARARRRCARRTAAIHGATNG